MSLNNKLLQAKDNFNECVTVEPKVFLTSKLSGHVAKHCQHMVKIVITWSIKITLYVPTLRPRFAYCINFRACLAFRVCQHFSVAHHLSSKHSRKAVAIRPVPDE